SAAPAHVPGRPPGGPRRPPRRGPTPPATRAGSLHRGPFRSTSCRRTTLDAGPSRSRLPARSADEAIGTRADRPYEATRHRLPRRPTARPARSASLGIERSLGRAEAGNLTEAPRIGKVNRL